jgi:hypothetical protein
MLFERAPEGDTHLHAPGPQWLAFLHCLLFSHRIASLGCRGRLKQFSMTPQPKDMQGFSIFKFVAKFYMGWLEIDRIYLQAHRGGRGNTIENTLPSFAWRVYSCDLVCQLAYMHVGA